LVRIFDWVQSSIDASVGLGGYSRYGKCYHLGIFCIFLMQLIG
jgi:hypothetical protein